MSRIVRCRLAHQAICKCNAPAILTLAAVAAGEFWSKMAQKQWTAWFDTFYTRLFVATPHEGSKSLNYTAVLTLPHRLPLVIGWPMLDTLVASIPEISRFWCASFNDLITRLRGFMPQHIRGRYVPCPLDVRKMRVCSEP